jgi:hypothetical protein
MEKNRPTVIAVCDAGPLIHLDELDCLPLLTDFRVWVPEAVWSEVWRHRPTVFQQSVVPFERHVAPKPIPPTLLALSYALALDAGEIEAVESYKIVPG